MSMDPATLREIVDAVSHLVSALAYTSSKGPRIAIELPADEWTDLKDALWLHLGKNAMPCGPNLTLVLEGDPRCTGQGFWLMGQWIRRGAPAKGVNAIPARTDDLANPSTVASDPE